MLHVHVCGTSHKYGLHVQNRVLAPIRALQEPPQMTDEEATKAAEMWDEAHGAANASAAAAEAEEGAEDEDMDTGDGADPKQPQDLT